MSEVEAWLVPYLPTGGRLALDVGANVGSFTGFLCERFSEVHAFEPNPQAIPTLRARAPRNARIFEAALGDRVGDLSLYIYERHENASSFRDDDLDTMSRGVPIGSSIVPLWTLDGLGYADRLVDFLKVDTEGAEFRVLYGARETLRRHRPGLLVEVHAERYLAPIRAILAEAGYGDVAHVPHPNPLVHPGHCWLSARKGET